MNTLNDNEARAGEVPSGRMTPEQLQEFENLLDEFNIAAFDCGRANPWREDYRVLLERRDKAREAVIAFVKELGK
jgi:hypothetical protein